MADVRPFRGFRYDLSRAGALADLLAPPYDVVGPADRAALAGRSPFNAVRVEVPEDDGAVDRYTAAARTLNGWVAADAVRQDSARGVYVLEQEFTVDGRVFTRRGFLARVRVEPADTGVIFPHEETLPGPKADRLKLYRATGFNVSPVFGLYPDDGGVMARLTRAVAAAPPVVAADPAGVTHRLWAVTDQATLSAVTGLMGPKPVTIADGHHRYETARRYRDEAAPADPDAAANFCLMHLVGTGDPGLVVLPTHRVFSGLPPLSAAELQARLAPEFAVVGEFPDAAACWEHVQLEDDQAVLGFVTSADGRAFAARLVDAGAAERAAPTKSPEWRSLGVSVLHEVAAPKFAAGAAVRYHHDLSGVVADLSAGTGGVGVLVPAATVNHVEVIAAGRERMPAKSTFFYPKVPTGLVFYSLKRE